MGVIQLLLSFSLLRKNMSVAVYDSSLDIIQVTSKKVSFDIVNNQSPHTHDGVLHHVNYKPHKKKDIINK